jgi:hypothetical protein
MKVTLTYVQLLDLVKNVNSVVAERGSKKEVKLKKIADKVKPILEEFNEKRSDIRLDNAYTNDKGVLELDEKGDYKFTKEGVKKLNKDLKELLEQTFDFYQFTFSTEGIEDLTFLAGWVEGIEAEKNQEDESAK